MAKNFKENTENSETDIKSGSQQNSNKNKNRRRKYTDKNKKGGRKYASNPPEIWTVYKTLSDDASRVQFGYPFGLPLDLVDRITDLTDMNVENLKIQQPGVLAYYVNPSIGRSTADNTIDSPANYAASQIFNAMRSALSGRNTRYEQADVMLYYLAVVDIMKYMTTLVRAFTVGHAYNTYNLSLPYALIKAMNVDLFDLQRNYEDYRSQLNALSIRCSTLYIPTNVGYTQRNIFQYKDVYIDENSMKSQMFIVHPFSIWRFKDNYDEHGGGLETVRIIPKANEQLWTFQDHIDLLITMIDAIDHSSDMKLIQSDLRSTMNDTSIVFPEIGGDLAFKPVQVDALLKAQLCNAVITGIPENNDVSQNENSLSLIHDPVFNRVSTPGMSLQKLLNTGEGSVDTNLIMDMTRYTVSAREVLQDGKYVYTYLNTGTDYVPMCAMFDDITYNNTWKPESWDTNYWTSTNTSAGVGAYQLTNRLQTFSCHPTVYFMQAYSGQYRLVNTACELANFTRINYDQLAQLHKAALYSAFYMPQFDTYKSTK